MVECTKVNNMNFSNYEKLNIEMYPEMPEFFFFNIKIFL